METSQRTSSGAALAILGATALLAATLMARPYLWGRSVEGRVTEVVRGHRDACSPTVEYAVDGRTYRLVSAFQSRPCSWSVGETVGVHFLAENPSDGHVLAGAGSVPLALLFLFGVGLFAAGGQRMVSRGRDVAASEPSTPPPLRLAEAPLGEVVAVTGALHVLTELRSPLTDEICGAWHVRVRRPVHGHSGELVCTAAKMNGFELRDGDVTLEVGPRTRLRLDLAPSATGTVRRQPAPRLAELLRSQRADAIDADPTQNDYDWSEAVVREGDPVTVVARLERAAAPEGAADAAGRVVLRAVAPPSSPVLVRSGPPPAAASSAPPPPARRAI